MSKPNHHVALDIKKELSEFQTTALEDWLKQPPVKFMFTLLPKEQHDMIRESLRNTFEAGFTVGTIKLMTSLKEASEQAMLEHFSEKKLEHACAISAANGGAQA